ncbi:LPS export ABC transporter periplasmic protein LptC [Beggiatoa leptomitoformis]|uniref:LPS export ABC transporter periplasmic protein LptC n=1 Tax=Beggiatoa leptomitoformis TaxID=288004 RepID=A0A2N9YHZ9_9GAMM|nr:LPS export ABC transporter periplasmic protein LptC [Beggiatoa leptomitoformis]ALG67616.1 LPS export ABC transporter periplasmic protein LptC [Beggiatoa leptomitoformis]AUI70152.1 LPS export ABC transporter periplasmic protein LptC [Beggiatoa leptomitoformis]
MDKEQWAGWTLLLLVAGFSTIWLYRMEKDSAIMSEEDLSRVPDYTLGRFTATQLDKTGLLQHRLTAETMVHYPVIETELRAPVLFFYDKGQPAWQIVAEQGRVSPDNKNLWLLGETIMERQSVAPTEQLRLISRDVWIQVEPQTAETIEPTTILGQNAETHSVGMKVYLPTHVLELRSQVRGRYVYQ